MKMKLSLSVLLAVLTASTQGFVIDSSAATTTTTTTTTTRKRASSGPRLAFTTTTAILARKGGVGLGKGSNSDSAGSSRLPIDWIPLQISSNQLPSEDGKVGLIDTNLISLKNGATNPTGAVSVAKLAGETFCFAVNCPTCQIPLTKAKLLPGPQRVCCDFCKATFNLKTGAKVESAESGGLFGGVIKSLLSAKTSGPLAIYKLGEKNGKLLIAMD
jgi:nitrite reductase/ring-hydroxylating ferredoxin subunit